MQFEGELYTKVAKKCPFVKEKLSTSFEQFIHINHAGIIECPPSFGYIVDNFIRDLTNQNGSW